MWQRKNIEKIFECKMAVECTTKIHLTGLTNGLPFLTAIDSCNQNQLNTFWVLKAKPWLKEPAGNWAKSGVPAGAPHPHSYMPRSILLRQWNGLPLFPGQGPSTGFFSFLWIFRFISHIHLYHSGSCLDVHLSLSLLQQLLQPLGFQELSWGRGCGDTLNT